MFSTVFMLFFSYTLSLSLPPRPRRNTPAAGGQQTQPVDPPPPAEPPARSPRRPSAGGPVRLGKRTRALDDDGRDEDGRAPWRSAEGPAEGQEWPLMVHRPATSEGEPMAVDGPAPLAHEPTVLAPTSTNVQRTTTPAEGPVRRPSPYAPAGSWPADSPPLARNLHSAIDFSSVTMGTRIRHGTLFPWEAWKDAASHVAVSAPAASPAPFTPTTTQPGPRRTITTTTATTTTTTTIHYHPTPFPPSQPFPSQPAPPNPNPNPALDDGDDDIPDWAYDESDSSQPDPSQPDPNPFQEGPSNPNRNRARRDNDIPTWAYDDGSDDGAGKKEGPGLVLSARRMPVEWWERDLIPEGSGVDKGKGRAVG
jgi:hypothetical protein